MGVYYLLFIHIGVVDVIWKGAWVSFGYCDRIGRGETNIDGMPCANDAVITSIIIIILGKDTVRKGSETPFLLHNPSTFHPLYPLTESFAIILPSIHSLTCIRCAVAGPWSLRPDP